jgi:hypothetical protein
MLREHKNLPFWKIGKELGCDSSTAQWNYNKYYGKHNFYEITPGRGQPPVFDHHDHLLATRKICSSAAQDAADFHFQEFPHVGASTICRELAKMGFHGHQHHKKPLLTKKHIQQHSVWSKVHANWTESDWAHVMFTDESKFMIHGSDGIQYCCRGPNEELELQNVQTHLKHGSSSLMVWGCITSQGFGWLYIEGRMTGVMYCDIMKEGILGTLKHQGLNVLDIIFQQDNDPKHTS